MFVTLAAHQETDQMVHTNIQKNNNQKKNLFMD